MATAAKVTPKPGKLFIGGQWRDADGGATYVTVNPATGETNTTIAEADQRDADAAVRAARKAFESGPWPEIAAADRGKLLWRIADSIEKHADELAALETLDNGKPIFESRQVDIPMVAEVFRYFAGWATKICGETVPVRGPFFNYTLREPIGVIAAIVPWNFPLLMASWKIAPALAAGNTVVLKPAPWTPMTALRFGEICQEAGVPDGVVNILTGSTRELGKALVRHPGVDKIAFTGSTATGQDIIRNSADSVKPVSLELGGKSPNIVLPDADFMTVLPPTVQGVLVNTGQSCIAPTR